jgi:hypothetical protein
MRALCSDRSSGLQRSLTLVPPLGGHPCHPLSPQATFCLFSDTPPFGVPAPLLRLVSHFAAARRNVANWRSGVDWASQILVLRVDLDDICHALRPPQYAVYSPRRHHSSGSVGSVGSVDRLSTRYAHHPLTPPPLTPTPFYRYEIRRAAQRAPVVAAR